MSAISKMPTITKKGMSELQAISIEEEKSFISTKDIVQVNADTLNQTGVIFKKTYQDFDTIGKDINISIAASINANKTDGKLIDDMQQQEATYVSVQDRFSVKVN